MRALLPPARLAALAVFATALGPLGGCMVGPDYHPPDQPTPAAYSELSAGQGVEGGAAAGLDRWWTQFGDAELDSLVARALAANLDLQQASSRILAARAQLRIAGAALWPSLNGSAGVNHLHSSQALIQAFGAQAGGGATAGGGGAGAAAGGGAGGGNPAASAMATAGSPTTLDLYQLGFDASWELDLWGGTRRGVEAAAADMAAAVEGQRDLQVSLLAELARSYTALRGLQQRIAIANDNLAAQEDELRLARARNTAGLASELDVEQLAAQAATTEASIPPLEAAVRQAGHAIALLLGEPPEALDAELAAPAAIPPAPPTVPVGMPSELLRRRPDVRRAERNLAGASARIGVATAQLFPSLNLTGSLGMESLAAKRLFDWGNHFYSIFPSLTVPIFEGGRLRANLNLAEENERQAALAYRSAVLAALRDVEDALAAYRTERHRLDALTRAVTADRRALGLARQQYRRGLVTVLSVLDVERALLAAQDAQAQSRQAVTSDLIALYKALGGGWSEEASPSDPPPAALQPAAASGDAGR